MPIPLIDDRIRHVGVSALRGLNAKTLRELKEMLVLQVDDKPIAVLIPYEMYLEMQKVLWPSSLLPGLEEVFLKEAFEGSARTPDSWRYPAPDMIPIPDLPEEERVRVLAASSAGIGPYANHYHKYLPNNQREWHHADAQGRETGVCDCVDLSNSGVDANPDMQRSMDSYSEITEAQRQYVTGAIRDCERLQSPSDIEVTAISTDATPRGGKFSRVDDSQPPVVDDIDILNVKVNGEDRGLQVPLCSHCGNPSETSPCSTCFTSGHRNGQCLVCTEKADE